MAEQNEFQQQERISANEAFFINKAPTRFPHLFFHLRVTNLLSTGIIFQYLPGY